MAIRVDTSGTTASEAADSDGECRLIERAKTDPQAFGRLFETHYERILTYTYRASSPVYRQQSHKGMNPNTPKLQSINCQ